MSIITIEYLAGFFDGEGSIVETVYKGVVAVVTNTYYPVLEEFKSRYGGSIHPKTRYSVSHRPCWCWQLTKQIDMAKFLLEIQPLLMEKRPQADIAMQILTVKLEGTGDDLSILHRRLKELKGRIS